MNRKGSLEWNLETLGKLVFYVLVLIAIVYMSYKLIALFVAGGKDYAATRNLELVEQRMEMMRKSQENLASIILSLPKNYEIRPFGPNDKSITIQYYCAPDAGIAGYITPIAHAVAAVKAGTLLGGIQSQEMQRPSRLKGCKGGEVCYCAMRIAKGESCKDAYSIVSCITAEGPTGDTYYAVHRVDKNGEYDGVGHDPDSEDKPLNVLIGILPKPAGNATGDGAKEFAAS